MSSEIRRSVFYAVCAEMLQAGRVRVLKDVGAAVVGGMESNFGRAVL
jgi:hypothetical protein